MFEATDGHGAASVQSSLLTRARAHLGRSPLAPPPDWTGAWLAKRAAADPALLWALGGLRPSELRAMFPGSLDEDGLGDLGAGMSDRIVATMRWLGLGCVEAALTAARNASLDPKLAGRIARTAVRAPGGSRLLGVAGLSASSIARLRAEDDDEEADAGVRTVFGAHRPDLAELRLRAFSSTRWDPGTQPMLRETVLALHGLTTAPADSLVRLAVGGRPWGSDGGTTVDKLRPRVRVRILLEVMRRVDGVGLGPATGLCLLAGLASVAKTSSAA